MWHKLGFMQGRMSPLVNGKIQAFPWVNWQEEFVLAAEHRWSLMEWTLDHENLHQNPLLTSAGQRKIQELSQQYGLRVESLTGDCFMQAPFYKAEGAMRSQLVDDLKRVVEACAKLDISLILIPLVDNGQIETELHQEILFETLQTLNPSLRANKQKIIFESDFEPLRLAKFIDDYDPTLYGINYDIGNSASLGYDPSVEIDCYGHRILNVHIKDRLLGGATVPLGQGNAKIELVLNKLTACGYSGNYILQAARAMNGNHVEQLNTYRSYLLECEEIV